MADRRLRTSLPSVSTSPATPLTSPARPSTRPSSSSLRLRCRSAAEPTPSCNARSNAWRTRRVSCPVLALSVTVCRVDLQHPRRALVPLLPHQLLQQRHEPHVVDVLHVPAVLDAVFGRFHGISSFIQFSPSALDRAQASLSPPQFPGVMHRHIHSPFETPFSNAAPAPTASLHPHIPCVSASGTGLRPFNKVFTVHLL